MNTCRSLITMYVSKIFRIYQKIQIQFFYEVDTYHIVLNYCTYNRKIKNVLKTKKVISMPVCTHLNYIN